MNRRDFIAAAMSTPALASVSAVAAGSASRARRVTFLLGDFTNMMDVAGPWEVFQDAMGMADGQMLPLYTLSTVAVTKAPVTMTGGMRVVPDYDLSDVHTPDIIVVPAHRGDARLLRWLVKASPASEITMSVCTGAFQLGRAGLLDGLPATTHHGSWDAFEREFRTTTLQRGARFVDTGRIVTAGGLTSGIDAALHVVQRTCGQQVSKATAEFMEYGSTEGCR